MEFELTGQKYTEKVNIQLLDAVLEHAVSKKENEQTLNLLRWIRKEARVGNGSFTTTYYQPNKYGRVEAFRKTSLSQVYRPYRHTLCSEYYLDIDMSNAQPTILWNICSFNKIACHMLSAYNNQRNKCLLDVMSHYDVNKDVAKQLFIIAMNNGSYTKWKDTNAPNKMDLPFVMKYYDEMENIINKLYTIEDNEPLVKVAKKLDAEHLKSGKKEFSNIKGSFMSLVLGDWEQKILTCVVKYMKEKYNTDEIILCHDGFMIPKHIITDIQSLLKELEQVVIERFKETHEFKNLDFKNKPMDEGLDIKPKEVGILDGKDYETLKAELEKDNGLFYCKSDKKFYRKMLTQGLIQYIHHTSSEMNTALAGFKVIDTTPQGLQKLTSFFSKWSQDPKRREIDEFVYDVDPDYVEKDSEVNLWEGFAIEKVPREEFSVEMKSSIDSTFDRYFTSLGNGNEKVKTYLINWIAHLIQRPHIYLPTVPFLQSADGGTGKSAYSDIIGYVLGNKDKYVCRAHGFAELNSQYTGHLRHSFLYCAEELEYEDGKKNINFLKAWTTNQKLIINEKYGGKIEIPNKVRIMITTNGLNTIPVEEGQRRLVMTTVSNELKNDKAFFDRMYDEYLKNKSVCRYLYDWFKSIDLTTWDHKDIPETTLMCSLKEVNRELLEEFIEDNIHMLYTIEDKDGIGATELLNKVNKWLVNGNYKFSYSSAKLGLVINNNKIASAIFEKKRTNKGVVYKINKDHIKDNYKFNNDNDNNDECLF